MLNGTDLVVVAVLAGGIRAAVPLYVAALGEVYAEKSGVVNLGVEGLMLMGAVCGVAATVYTGSPWIGLLVAMLVGGILAACHGLATIWLSANQIAVGIAMIVLGTGLSGLLGIQFVGKTFAGFSTIPIPYLSDIAVLGPILFRHDILTYLSFLLVPTGWWLLYRTEWGLQIRAVGDDAEASSLIGLRVRRLRFSAVVLGGILAGFAGADLSLAYSQLWQENMVAGRGLIALALVVFGSWDPRRVYLGALFFGTVSALQLRLQTVGVYFVSPYMLAMLPYVLTIVVLVYASRRLGARVGGVPRALGTPFAADR